MVMLFIIKLNINRLLRKGLLITDFLSAELRSSEDRLLISIIYRFVRLFNITEVLGLHSFSGSV